MVVDKMAYHWVRPLGANLFQEARLFGEKGVFDTNAFCSSCIKLKMVPRDTFDVADCYSSWRWLLPLW